MSIPDKIEPDNEGVEVKQIRDDNIKEEKDEPKRGKCDCNIF